MAIDWRIYYDDFSTFDSSNGEPEDAPPFGVQAIVYPFPETGRIILSKWDYYYYKDNEWWGSDLIGMIDQFANFPKRVRALKIGRTISNEDFGKITKKAREDKDFPKKSATHSKETP